MALEPRQTAAFFLGLLLARSCCHAELVSTTAELLRAFRDATVDTVLLRDSLTINGSVWGAGAVQLDRSLTVSATPERIASRTYVLLDFNNLAMLFTVSPGKLILFFGLELVNHFDTVGPSFRPLRQSVGAWVVFENCMQRRRAGLPYAAAVVNMVAAIRPANMTDAPQTVVLVSNLSFASTRSPAAPLTYPQAISMFDYATTTAIDSSLAFQGLYYGGYTYYTVRSYYMVDNFVQQSCLDQRPGSECVTLLLQQLNAPEIASQVAEVGESSAHGQELGQGQEQPTAVFSALRAAKAGSAVDGLGASRRAGGGQASLRPAALSTATDLLNSTLDGSLAAVGGTGEAAVAAVERPRDVLAELDEMSKRLRDGIRDKALVLEGIVGSGSFGTVYKGTWQGLSVAVKTVVFSASTAHRRRALQEAALCQSITHPNVVRDAGEPCGFAVKVGDFGLSVMLPQHQTHLSNMRMGTMFYMCPAIVLKGQVGPSSDVFSLGVMLWELYHGRPAGVSTAEGPRYSTVFPSFPPACLPGYRAVTLHCLQRQPQNRPPAPEVAERLEWLLTAQVYGGGAVAAAPAPLSAAADPSG
ncbi:putative LRR receptor-like serine/threonine-protein kinase, partial [Tetrabaena socialis]